MGWEFTIIRNAIADLERGEKDFYNYIRTAFQKFRMRHSGTL